ncbi:MAG: hypothetical protein AB1634_16095 [Thermodesulfobacteriota bacterium]
MNVWLRRLPVGALLVLAMTGTGQAADFDVEAKVDQGRHLLVITSNIGHPAYLYDLVRADGSSIGIHANVVGTVAVETGADPGGVVKARCLAAEGSPDWQKYLRNPKEGDGFFHFTAQTRP